MEDLQRRRLSILLFTGITLGWMILCYIAWVASGCKPFMPFISDFDLFEPGDTMFSLGTFLTTITVVWIMIEIQLFNRERLLEKDAHFVWANNQSCCIVTWDGSCIFYFHGWPNTLGCRWIYARNLCNHYL